jgi:hypothetical protein
MSRCGRWLLSDYKLSIRHELGLTRYNPAELLRLVRSQILAFAEIIPTVPQGQPVKRQSAQASGKLPTLRASKSPSGKFGFMTRGLQQQGAESSVHEYSTQRWRATTTSPPRI